MAKYECVNDRLQNGHAKLCIFVGNYKINIQRPIDIITFWVKNSIKKYLSGIIYLLHLKIRTWAEQITVS